jgi:GNAT superfamily N-acetyltransferase
VTRAPDDRAMPASAARTYVVRRAREQDAPELARLLTGLGHPTEAGRIAALWAEWEGAGNSALAAVADGGSLLGVATLHSMLVLHRPRPVGRITALVVDEAERGRGIGRALVAAAEDALRRAGCGLLEITSNARLVDAHAFYEGLGYERTSVRLVKSIEARG